MRRNKKLLRFSLIATPLLLALFIIGGHGIKAAFYDSVLTTYVEIDGVNFGPFDDIDGIEQFASDGFPLSSDSYATVTLEREFVTSPSLYLWVKNRMRKKTELKDIHLITENEEGDVVAHQILQLCQPLSWSVEAADPTLGGFNETVDFAVQKITEF
ncbi:MAG: hypothetical protein HRU19_09455 [Pseudobacteriovorax sp.]|nr:hypothetical protein [Pseudobacteriovorax sp.]